MLRDNLSQLADLFLGAISFTEKISDTTAQQITISGQTVAVRRSVRFCGLIIPMLQSNKGLHNMYKSQTPSA